MNQRIVLWLLLTMLYSTFVFWYTNTKGPLTEAEINDYLARWDAQETDLGRDVLERFMRSDTGKQFIMVNLLDYDESPQGKFAGRDPQELLDHYMEYMYPALFKRASHPIFAGIAVNTAMDLQGIEGAEVWDTGALMRYRSRRDLLEIALNPAFGERHDHKMAALTKTIAYPVEVLLSFADPRFHLAMILLVMGLLLDRLFSRRSV